MRVGFGYDCHRLVEGRRLILGGVDIPHDRGLLGHSDGDAICHAIIDAVIGALGMGDIGKHFPDTDPRWKDVSSITMLGHVLDLAREAGFKVSWVDSTVIAEEPRLAPYMEAMKAAISEAGIRADEINIKAKTSEGMGFAGRGEGIAAYAVCLLKKMPGPA